MKLTIWRCRPEKPPVLRTRLTSRGCRPDKLSVSRIKLTIWRCRPDKLPVSRTERTICRVGPETDVTLRTYWHRQLKLYLFTVMLNGVKHL